MDVTLFRIDDRLIHGQIVTAWLQNSGASQILVADDQAGNDAFQKSLLAMAVPPGVDLTVLPLAEASELLASDTTTTKTLLLARGPAQALELVRNGLVIKEINVGNLNMKPGKQKIITEMWLDADDVAAFKGLNEAGVGLEQRVIPGDRRTNAMDLVRKFKG